MDTTKCIDHYTRTVSEWTKDNTILFGLQDMCNQVCFQDLATAWLGNQAQSNSLALDDVY